MCFNPCTSLKSPCFQQLKKEAETEFKQAKAEAILKASKEIEKVKSGMLGCKV